ncbi:hypothetical protein TSUD_15310 [Trifolium subterraneum]|uniref:Methyltransferase n=1 Tax=Trifolium subterraneum TaxID=3900 RepID=A0A2Z6MQS1_TRISU|nr:hypothetical protein TSUD_15310 [Trifolium subterraneum]
MKSLDILKTPSSVKIITLTLFSLTLLIFLFTNYSSTTISSLTFFSPSPDSPSPDQQPLPPSSDQQPPPPPPPPPSRTPKPPKPFIIPPLPVQQQRLGLLDENGVMTDNFTVGNDTAADDLLLNWYNNETIPVEKDVEKFVVNKFKICGDMKMVDYIPCLDNVEEILKFSGSERGEKYERHCPQQDKGLNCMVPRPKGYKKRIRWPQSRDEIWFRNVPHTRLVEDKGGQNWISIKKDKFVFPGGGTQFIHGADKYLDQISEANRLLRAGRYFVWAAQPVYKHEDSLQEQWKEMENLTARMCWELVRKEGYIAIWRKPMNNSCYLGRDTVVHPPLCESNDDPDDVWYVGLKACIAQLPDNGYGANVTNWPSRLHQIPDRLQSIKMDAVISRRELLKAESNYWHEIVNSYVQAFHWKEYKFRNVLDMRAGFGGFAAAMHDLQLDCWVMNVVPVNGFNTLPVIYDRGLIGVMHDWCEPFDTYPRTYDLLHAEGLFSREKKRKKCNISTIMLEMDRMLRPDGYVYIRDSLDVIIELEEISKALGWVITRDDVGEGPYASRKILRAEKRF